MDSYSTVSRCVRLIFKAYWTQWTLRHEQLLLFRKGKSFNVSYKRWKKNIYFLFFSFLLIFFFYPFAKLLIKYNISTQVYQSLVLIFNHRLCFSSVKANDWILWDAKQLIITLKSNLILNVLGLTGFGFFTLNITQIV